MSASVSLAAMITAVQQRAGLVNQAGFVTLPEIRGYLNEGLAELWDLLVEARGHEHMRKQSSFSTTANTSAYPLAADFYELISVDVQISNNQFMSATPYMEWERNFFKLVPGWFPGWSPSMRIYYRILGSTVHAGAAVAEKTINFTPTPLASYPILLNYVYTFPVFLTDGTQDAFLFDGVNGWESYAIWDAVAACKAKLKEDGSFAVMKKEGIKQRIQALAPQNDAGDAERIRDVYADVDFTGW